MFAEILMLKGWQYYRRRCSIDMGRVRSGLHVTGPRSRSLEASFVPVDWRVRVFGPSVIVNIPSDRLYVRNIPLYGCMVICSRYIDNRVNLSQKLIMMCV